MIQNLKKYFKYYLKISINLMSEQLFEKSLFENIESIKNEIIDDDYNNFELFTNHQINYSEESQNNDQNNDQNKTDKYGDDLKFEGWGDNNIFFPIAKKLIDPLYNLSLTPNNISILSTIFTFLAIYFFHNNERVYALIAFLIGYILDCVDGKMARKYNMMSKYGMALDLVSDHIGNISIIAYLISKYGLTNKYILAIIFMSFMISISFGLNEAIASYKATGNDNFVLRRENELKTETGYIYTLFLYIMKLVYRSYRLFFKEYNEEKIIKMLSVLKEFGPGNYCLLIVIVLLYIE